MDAATRSGTRWLDDREQAAWRAFLSVQTRLNAQLGREMQDESGLSLADFSVLVSLSEHADSRMRVLELARALEWEKSRLSHQLTRMQQRGLIERSNCSEDRRGAFVVLTERGRAAVENAAPRHVEAVRTYLFDAVTEAEVDALAQLCRTVLGRLDAAMASQCPSATAGECTGTAPDAEIAACGTVDGDRPGADG